MPESESRVNVRGRTLNIVLLSGLAVALVALVLAIAILRTFTERLPRDVAGEVAALPRPTVTVTVTPGVDPAPPPDLADQVAVAWSVATGWPHSEKWGDILYFTSYQDDLLVHTNMTDAADMSEVCTMLLQLNDPVLALDPPIDQVLFTGTDGQVIWSCVSSSEVQ